MQLDTEDFDTVIGVLRTHAEQQYLRATKKGEELGLARIASPRDPGNLDLEAEIGELYEDADNLSRIANQFEVGLTEPATVIA